MYSKKIGVKIKNIIIFSYQNVQKILTKNKINGSLNVKSSNNTKVKST